MQVMVVFSHWLLAQSRLLVTRVFGPGKLEASECRLTFNFFVTIII